MSTLPPFLTEVYRLELAQLVGLVFNVGLQSALTVQTYVYHVCFPDDPLIQKCLVYLVCIYEWVQTGLVVVKVFHSVHEAILSGNNQDLQVFCSLLDQWGIIYIMCAIQSAAVQAYFARRIYILSRSRITTGFVIVMALAQMCSGIIFGVSTLIEGLSTTVTYGANISWLVGSAVADLTIAITLVILFHKMKNGLKQTDILMKRLARVVIETGTLTATTAIVASVLLFMAPAESGPDWAVCLLLFLSKLYANSVLFTLNNRAIIKSTQDEDGRTAIMLSPTVTHLHNHNHPLEIVADEQRSPIVISIVREEDVYTSAVKHEESV
ncbi:uncharacterized protein LAESUDRAFT_539852 [Laetiporus sulphureus 93-53]|uniref:DUF6534 domain-containing protein n=1 Tax=Laetiporus sulphureus 93-53 TaxID=1314785 RepID=A0A165FLH0_9APHY|nr:uncharacterized protein LAESUDRAFT_539852 [Laetiporus sulphureus 93-53]KZT09148.1 hypothetical protein LAESUDRAFT_539852 [Laetiporus sulphureus 93-53]